MGPYQLAGVLGAGGMGRVFLGWSPDGRPVAVLDIRPELAADPEFRARSRPFLSSNDQRGAARAQCVPKRAALATATQVRVCSRAVCKAALLVAPVLMLIPQNGLFCALQLRNGEYFQ